MALGQITPVGPDQFFRVRSLETDAASNSTTTGVEITGLELKSVGPGVYVVEYFIVYQSAATTTGVKFGINHTGTVSSFVATSQIPTASTTTIVGAIHDQATTTTPTMMGSNSVRTRSTTAPNIGPWPDIDSANSDMQVYIYCNLVVTVIGDLELWHASEAAAASTVKAGSTVCLTKFA